jgi:hypothetical protein
LGQLPVLKPAEVLLIVLSCDYSPPLLLQIAEGIRMTAEDFMGKW